MTVISVVGIIDICISCAYLGINFQQQKKASEFCNENDFIVIFEIKQIQYYYNNKKEQL